MQLLKIAISFLIHLDEMAINEAQIVYCQTSPPQMKNIFPSLSGGAWG